MGDYDSNESYTQRDALREAYIDTEINDFSIRAGKQQVVWGTADGIKLLDAINPTDCSEMAQNQMEDSRIPVWMLNTETDTSNGGNWQFIASQSKSSHFAGMGDSSSTTASTHYSISDSGNAFVMKGVDTISGRVNGMINVVPALGSVSSAFQSNGNTNGMTMADVNDFMTGTNAGEVDQRANFAGICNAVAGLTTNAACMEHITNQATTHNGGGANVGANNANAQNLFSDTALAQWNTGKDNATQVFHYMPNATFATFDQFVGVTSKYVVDHDSTPVLSARYKNTTSDGLNYSMNVIHDNDTNPYIDTYWTNSADGSVLEETASTSAGGVYVTNNLGDGNTVGGSAGGGNAVFNMVEKLNKITQLGGSFDTANLGAIVLRGEALYQKDVMSPIVTRKDASEVDLNHGFLVNALKMVKGNRFKYVLGADMTVLTNMMVSAQFIQDRNLDYVNTGDKDATNWKYTADQATIHLTNNLNKAEKNKEFGS
ncbi:hypothetical protein CRYPA_1599 [uncultured Candidatus Thioglobus sp.]|nr:hypothetical protein CRYPA_1599 [uncultured Candidatus Thioglobus sp.]